MVYECIVIFVCFKQKAAYEMRISDWSSDVCSSDLGQSVHLLGGNLDAVRLTDFRQQQSQANAADGDLTIILPLRLKLRLGGFRIGFMTCFMLKLLPDLREFGLHH